MGKSWVNNSPFTWVNPYLWVKKSVGKKVLQQNLFLGPNKNAF